MSATCQRHKVVSHRNLRALPESQAGDQRHRCAACAYELGLAEGAERKSPATAAADVWFANHAEVCALARVLARSSMLATTALAIDFFEKPWKWTDEHASWVAAGRPDYLVLT